MKLLSRKAGSFKDLLEAMCDDGTREWHAGQRREYEIPLIALPALTCSKPLLDLPGPVAAEGLDQGSWERDRAS